MLAVRQNGMACSRVTTQLDRPYLTKLLKRGEFLMIAVCGHYLGLTGHICLKPYEKLIRESVQTVCYSLLIVSLCLKKAYGQLGAREHIFGSEKSVSVHCRLKENRDFKLLDDDGTSED